MITPPQHLQHISDQDLIDEMINAQLIVDDCIELAQKKALSTDEDYRHQCQGLYFAQLQYNQLVAEMQRRFYQNEINNKFKQL